MNEKKNEANYIRPPIDLCPLYQQCIKLYEWKGETLLYFKKNHHIYQN